METNGHTCHTMFLLHHATPLRSSSKSQQTSLPQTLSLQKPPPKTMAQYSPGRPNATVTATGGGGGGSFLQKLREHAPNSTQLIGLATLVISGGILLLLAGVTLTSTVMGLIFFAPLVLISSPIWFPIAIVIFVVIAGFLSFFGFGVAAVAVVSWLYRYFRGFHPVGSDRVDYARTRIADTAGHVKEYAREYGGYLHGKVKDAAPSA